MIGPRDAWLLRRLLTGHEVNPGELSGPFRRAAEMMAALPGKGPKRKQILDGFLCARDVGQEVEIVKALAAADPEGPCPEPESAAARFATMADVRRGMSETRWLWSGWIPSSRIVGIGAFEGVGKSRIGLDLCRRAYLGLPWPDNQGPTLPVGSRSIWMCSDANQDELAEMLPAFGLPDRAIVLPTAPEEPYGGTDLDNPETLAVLEEAVRETKPAFVFVDTLTSATSRDLCDQRTMKPLKSMLANITQSYNVTIILLLHLSREGQALGRRVKGITRSLIHLECPDPERPGRLRLWVEKSFAKKPPPLGVTMGDTGNEYDSNPPAAPEANRGGRPPEKTPKAVNFLTAKLTDGDRKQCELIDEWIELGESKGTIFNAMKAMQVDGRLVVDDSAKPKVCHLVKNRQEPGF